MRMGFFFLLISLVACDYADNRLVINNRTEKEISFEFFFDSVPIFTSANGYQYYSDNILKPNESKKISRVGGKNAWLLFFNKSSNTKINIIFFDIKELEKLENLDDLVQCKKYYKILHFSKDEIQKRNWIIDLNKN